ncbi:MAG: DUF4404 family protein [Actinobacteria bacterium]|nr:DUF4404 family protein [Actinomycetota bacterium]
MAPVRSSLANVSVMDDDIRRLLTDLDEALVRRVEKALGDPGGEHEGVVDRLESTAVRFEDRHSTLAGLLRSAVDTLSASGI